MKLLMKFNKWRVVVPYFAVFCMSVALLWKGGKTIESVLAWTLCSLGAFTLLWHYGYQSQKKIVFSWVKLGFPFLFVLGTFLSYVFSETKNVGLDEVWMTLAMVMMYVVLIYRPPLAPLQNFETKFFRSAPALLMLAFCIGFIVYITQPVNRFVGSFFDYRFHTDFWPNAWAQWLLIFWPMLAISFLGRLHTWPRRLWAVLVASVVLASLWLSYSRGANLAFAGQMGLLSLGLLWRAFHQNKKKSFKFWAKKGLSYAGIAMVVLILSFGIFKGVNTVRAPFQEVQSVIEKVKFEAQEGTSSVNERAQFWKQSWQMFLEKPVLGYGPYSFPYVQSARMEGVLASSDHAHNVLLKWASERGFATSLSFLLWMGLLAYQSLMHFYRQKKSRDYFQSLFLWIGLAGLMAHNMMDYNLQFVGILAPMSFALALLAREIPDQEIMPSLSVSFKSYLVGLLLLGFLGLHLVWEAGMQWAMQRSRVYSHGEQHPIALQWMKRAQYTRLPKDLYLRMAENYEFQGEWEKALASTLDYGEKNEHDFSYWKRRAFYEKKLGQADASNASITQAMEKGFLQDAQIFRLYLEAEKETGLKIRRADLISLFDRYIEAVLNNAHFIALSRTPEELVKIADLLAEKYPRVADNVRAKAQEAMAHAEWERSRLKGRSF